MKIAVCIKQVPVVSLLKFDNEARRVVREGVPNEVNPFDVLAMSLAANLKREHNAEVVVYTMGPPQARDALVQCLAMGADRAVHLNDIAFAGSDTLATARTLALAIARDTDACDLIICGRNSVDAETSQVGAELAEMLDLPIVSAVRQLELHPNDASDANNGSAHLTAERITDAGYDVVRCQLPALITVTEDVAPEIYPRRADRQAAQEKPIQTLTAAELSDDASLFGAAGSPTSVSEIYTIEPQRDRILVRDKPPADAVSELMAYLRKRGVFADDGTIAPAKHDANTPSRGARRQRSDAGPVWVVAETLDGELRPITLELLGSAVAIAATLNTNVEAILFGADAVCHTKTLTAYGADVVHTADDSRLAHYENALYTQVLADAIAANSPYAVLIPSTLNGRELAARLAGRLSLGLTGDCIGLEVDADGRLVQLKPAFGGNIVAPILSTTQPYMATVRPSILTPVQPDTTVQPILQALPLDALPKPRTQTIERVANKADDGTDIDSAGIIVSVGKGIGGPENLPAVRELAATLGAPIGATRDVTELGWLPRQHQIGLSGKSVAPSLYIAVALSGVFNHTVGIQRAGTIVAINNSARAPIFQAADFGIIADYAEILPELVGTLKAQGERRRN